MSQALKRIARFYYEGFTGMKLGKTLWLVVLVKLFVMFAVIRFFFMPDVLSHKAAGGDKAGGGFIRRVYERQGYRELLPQVAADKQEFITPFGEWRGLQIIIGGVHRADFSQAPETELATNCRQ